MNAASAGAGRQAALRRELRDYAIVAAYLYVCLGVLAIYKTAILRDAGVAFSPLGFALVKALVLGKFALLGKAAGLGQGFGSTVGARIGWKSVLFALLLLALSLVEELVAAWWGGRSFAESLAHVASLPPLTVGADALVLLLIAVTLIAFIELGRALGPGELARVLQRRL
ncbi:MAG: hypothetical protein JNM50_02610 [Chromatiales bacterium]|jgi:hypothetical protein|nr:hypothetical protein [Chromatiales bacterium]